MTRGREHALHVADLDFISGTSSGAAQTSLHPAPPLTLGLLPPIFKNSATMGMSTYHRELRESQPFTTMGH